MALVRDTIIAETILTAIMLYNEFNFAEIEALWLSRTCIKIWGACFVSESSVVSVMAGWIAEVLFMLLYTYTSV